MKKEDQREEELTEGDTAENPGGEEVIQNTGDATSDVEIPESGNEESSVAALNDKYLRLYSEFDNFRRRSQRERAELIRTASEEVFKALLPVLDDFERAIASMQDAKDIEAIREGVGLIHHKLAGILDAKGLKAMESLGQPFDVEKHEAISQMKAPEPALKGMVIEELEKGYTLHDKVIRYAKVIIGQ